jgi:hypothetical protein
MASTGLNNLPLRGINAVEYLVALQEHRSEVFADPAAWLPWAYARSRASP